MTCPSYGSSSEVSLWYAIDPDPATAIPDGSLVGNAFTWYGIPMTGESIAANLSSTISEQITPQRSYAGSKLSQGEVSGSFNYECQASQFMYNMLLCALQSTQPISLGSVQVAGTSGVSINAVGVTVNASRTINLTGLTATLGATYTVRIDGEDFSFTAANTVLNDIATGLAAAINADDDYTAAASTATITISAGAGLSDIEFDSYTTTTWAPGESVTNGSTKNCLVFLKRVLVGSGKYDYYLFRGVQIGSLSFEIQPSSLITGTCNLMGIKPDAPLENVDQPTYWTFVDPPVKPLMSGVDSLRDFAIQTSAGVSSGVVMQSLSFTIDNQLRQQQAIGINSPFAAGIASGRFMASFSGSAYYANPRIYNDFVQDRELKITGKLIDGEGDGFQFLADFVKVTQGGLPMAESPDQDLLITTEFRAFESASNGTLKLTRLAG
jgi:Phage tail tube protein